MSVSTESGIPKDASGGIDYDALVQLLKDTQSLQDQADILYILFKDKWDTWFSLALLELLGQI